METNINENINTFCNLLLQNDDRRKILLIMDKFASEVLSYFQFYSLYCINSNEGNVALAKRIDKYLKDEYLKPFTGTVTLTYGEVAESHVGMQKIGNMADKGFSLSDLERAQKYFTDKGCNSYIIKLNNFLPKKDSVEDDEEENEQLNKAYDDDEFQAYLLVVRNGMECLANDKNGNNLLTEVLFFPWDTKLYNERRNVVQNKLARYNLNFDSEKQISDFEEGKGTTISWAEVPLVNNVRKKLVDAFGPAAKDLKCEGNKYYDYKNTGIGYHGDTERKKVIGVRLGRKMNIHWNWYYNDEPRGTDVSIILNPGDIYCMSEKTVGTDWRPNLEKGWKKKRYALRHAAGAPKYTTKTIKIQIRNQREWSENPEVIIGDIYHKPKKSLKNPNPDWVLKL